MTKNDILIVAVDHSAEGYAEDLVRHYSQADASAHFFGVGGDRLALAGVELLEQSRHLGVVGILEVVSSLKKLKNLQNKLVQACQERGVRAAILVDYPDFNLRLAKRLSTLGIRVYYYISPTIWAWRPGRIEWIRRYIRHLFLIFPFEPDLYHRAGIDHITYVGHPLLAKVNATLTKQAFLLQENIPADRDLMAILPGSRLGEVQRHLPIMLQSLQQLEKRHALYPVLLKADSIPQELLDRYLAHYPNPIAILPQAQAYNLISAAKVALTTCGTATLEIALLGTSMVVVYRVNPLSYLLGRRLMRIKHFSIVNILAGRPLVPELIQGRMSSQNINAAVNDLLGNEQVRSEQIAGFTALSRQLDPGKRPAATIVSTILADQLADKPNNSP